MTPEDLLVIFNPTNGININNDLPLLPINRALGLWGEDFWPFALLFTCL